MMSTEEVLVASLRRPPTIIPRRSIDSRFDLSELKNTCTLINTADYCQTTALELEENIREKCDEAFKEKVTLQEERDQFVRYGRPKVPTLYRLTLHLASSAISAAIGVMLRELESAIEPAFTVLSRTPWTTVKLVSGQSPYVQDLLNAIEQVGEAVKPLIEQKKYLRNFFDKAARLVMC